MDEEPPCRLRAGPIRLGAASGGEVMASAGPLRSVGSVGHGRPPQTRSPSPRLGARGSRSTHAVPPNLITPMRADHLCGCNGPSRLPYCAGNHTGLPLRFGVTLAGGFHRASAGPAHSRRPGLPEASTRLLVPVNTLMAYRLSRIARSSAYLR